MTKARLPLTATVLALGWSGVAPAAAAPPQNLAPPALEGSARVGATLRTTPGRWNTPLDSVTVRWERCLRGGVECQDIPEATAQSYVVRPDDAARTLHSRVTVSRDGLTATARSGASPRVGPEAPALAASTAGAEAAFAFLGEEGARFECLLDGGAVEPCASPVRRTSLPPGPHRFTVAQIGTDSARSPLAAFDWVIAAEPPFVPPLDDALPPSSLENDFDPGAFSEFGPFSSAETAGPEAGSVLGDAARGAGRLRVATRYRRRLRSVLREGAQLRIRCPIACSVTARLTLRASAGRPLGLRLRSPLLVATHRTAGTGTLTLVLRPRPRVAAALKRARRPVTLGLRVTAGPESRSARVTLRP